METFALIYLHFALSSPHIHPSPHPVSLSPPSLLLSFLSLCLLSLSSLPSLPSFSPPPTPHLPFPPLASPLESSPLPHPFLFSLPPIPLPPPFISLPSPLRHLKASRISCCRSVSTNFLAMSRRNSEKSIVPLPATRPEWKGQRGAVWVRVQGQRPASGPLFPSRREGKCKSRQMFHTFARACV